MPKKDVLEMLTNVSLKEERELQEKIADPGELIPLAEEMLAEQETIANLEAQVKQHKDRYNQLRTREIPDTMRRLGMLNSAGKGSFTFRGGKIHLETRLSASCAQANQPELFAWLREHQAGDLIKEGVHQATLTAFVKDRREQGLEDPPGISVWEETKAKLTGTKG